MLIQSYEPDFIFTATQTRELSSTIYSLTRYPTLWGQGVAEPTGVITGIELKASDLKVMGAEKDSSKFLLGEVECVRFKDDDFINLISAYPKVLITLYGTFAMNFFMEEFKPQFKIVDYKIEDWRKVF